MKLRGTKEDAILGYGYIDFLWDLLTGKTD